MKESALTKIGNLAIKVARVVVVSTRAQVDGARQRGRGAAGDQNLDAVVIEVGGCIGDLSHELPIQVQPGATSPAHKKRHTTQACQEQK